MNWNWEAHRWKKSKKLLLALATLWPPVYMVLFMLTIFSFILLIPSTQTGASRDARDIDLIQLDRKIRNGEIRQLTIADSEVIAVDRDNITYRTSVTSESTKEEIKNEAREPDANGRPRVEVVEAVSQTASPFIGIGFAGLFAAHLLTMFLMLGLMPVYIVLVVKNARLDETMRIVWVILICMLGIFAMPVYWYLNIWRDAPPAVQNPT
jgi:hypothetical protein